MECELYDKNEKGICTCRLCPRRCRILPSQRGWCRTRWNDHGTLKALTYGLVTSAALDPIEKKPLSYFHPGSVILSLGSWGCNMNCLFCQNYEISQKEPESRKVSPQDVLRLARALTAEGNIGVAWTYNEPTLSFEFIRDTAPLIREAGLMNVMVSNGFISSEALDVLLPLIDAWNIDLKGWNPDFYKNICGAAGIRCGKPSAKRRPFPTWNSPPWSFLMKTTIPGNLKKWPGGSAPSPQPSPSTSPASSPAGA